MIHHLLTFAGFVVSVAVAYALGHEDGRDAEFADRWDAGE